MIHLSQSKTVNKSANKGNYELDIDNLNSEDLFKLLSKGLSPN